MFTEKTFAVIDTETKGGVKDTYCPAYHCGATAITRRETKSTINIVVIENLDMVSAFYGKQKKEYYRDLLKDPSVVICFTEEEAKAVFSKWLADNNVTCVCAHNTSFDFCRTFVRECIEGMEFFDIMFAFFDTIGQTKKYNQFCAENGYYTASGNCRITAEICYRFVTNDISFIEEHTALADSLIEAEILRACWATHKKFTRNAHKGDYRAKQIRCKI